MGLTVLAVSLAIIAGAAIAIQSALNNMLTKYTGVWTTNSVVHGSGLIVAACIMLLLGKNQLAAISAAPWYSLLGGTLGVCIVASVIFAITQLKVGFTITILVVSQVVAATLIDHFGLLGSPVVLMDWKRALGICLLVAGALLIKK